MILKRRKSREKAAEMYLMRAAASPVPPMRPGRPGAIFAHIWERLEVEGGDSRRQTRRVFSTGRGWRRVAVTATIALLVFALMSSGAFAFSYDAAPGSTLYGTKLFFERIRLSLTLGDSAKFSYRLRLLEKRMRELEKMIAGGEDKGGMAWESAYRDEVEGLLGLISGLPEGQRERSMDEASLRLREQARRMETLLPASAAGMERHVRNGGELCEEAARRLQERNRRRGGGEGSDQTKEGKGYYGGGGTGSDEGEEEGKGEKSPGHDPGKGP